MITPAFGLTATERVLPNLALDFTTAVLDSRITFTRTTDATHPATYTDANNAIIVATNNQPRFDYASGVCKGLLIEESRTNSALNSILNGAVTGSPGTPPTSWINGAATGSISAIETAAYTSGYKLTFSCSNTRRGVYQLIASAANTSYTLSATVEIVSGTIAVWNLVNATILPTGAAISGYTVDGVSQVGSYNVSLGTHVITLTVTTSATIGAPAYAIGVGLQANSTAVVKFSNVQVEQGSFATSYIPTTTTALTRNADVATMTGTNFSDWFNASEGGAVIQVLPRTISGTRPAVEFDDNTANETIVLRGVAADPQLYVVDGGAAQATLDAGTITANAAYRLAGAWKSSSFATAINGAASVSQLSGTYPTVTQARFGSDGTNYLNGWLQNFRYWPQRITNAETQAFSK